MNRSLRFTEMLTGGDPNSPAATNSVAALADDSDAFADLWALLAHADPLVRRRAADAADQASRIRPFLLHPFADDLLSGRLEDGSEDLTWRLLPMAARLPLPPEWAARLMRRCEDAVLNHPSPAVQAAALGAAFALAGRDRRHVARVRSLARSALKSPSRKLADQARKLLDAG